MSEGRDEIKIRALSSMPHAMDLQTAPPVDVGRNSRTGEGSLLSEARTKTMTRKEGTRVKLNELQRSRGMT
jgi:hypothetical protein